MTTVLFALLIGYASIVGVVFVIQRSLMYHPGQRLPDPAATLVPEMVAVQQATADGLTNVSWYAPATGGKPTLVYFHGNAGHIADRDSKVRPYLDIGWGVMLVGYRGYGDNPGRPTEEGLYADGRAALAALEERGLKPDKFVIYGESLGTAIAVRMAWEMARNGHPVKALVLEAPFNTMGDAAANAYPFLPARLMVKDRYDSESLINKIATPLFVIHGDRDRVVPLALGQRLFAAAQPPKNSAWVTGASHNDLYDFGAARHVIGFINSLGA